MKRKKIFILFIVLLLVVAGISYRYLRSLRQQDPNTIRVSGNIEITDAELSFKIGGQVRERLVSEGQEVKAGQIVARLDSEELAQEVAVRKAEVQASEAVLAELVAGSRPEEIREADAAYQKAQAALDELLAGSRPQEIETAKASKSRAEADFTRWKSEFERQKSLHDQDIISSQDFEKTKASYQSANEKLREAGEQLKLVLEGPRKEKIDQAREAVKQAKARLDLAREGPRKETIDRARAQLLQAKASLGMAETRLSYATVYSPLSGIALSENVEPGEYVAPGTPVVTVGDLKNVWLRAYINEPDLGRVKTGQPVKVFTDTYPGKAYQGKISFLASEAEFTPKTVQTTEERVKLVYRIKVDIANPNMELKPGMPADAEIFVGQIE
ncbi:MAG: HlyD family efflux transporter periplasmic adaptor subunit [Desulfobacteraceae bacterium]|jgi:HlyD family secretion protein|nr:MAG: HlyD family efflux transporter periplasmic adaptor subunit [Desulfobacteraceae bacterium]